MRARFADELEQIERQLEQELAGIGEALQSIATIILDPAAGSNAQIDAAARRLRAVSRQIDEQLVVVTAQQAPVAGDLRLVLCLIQLSRHLALIANQFELIGEQLAGLDANAEDPQQTARQLLLMTDLAASQVQHATRVFATRDAEAAATLEREDDALDHLNRQVFEASVELDAGPRERGQALRYMLIARCLERVGDNAVDIAEQAVFLVTAELQEFNDASQPKARSAPDPEQ